MSYYSEDLSDPYAFDEAPEFSGGGGRSRGHRPDYSRFIYYVKGLNIMQAPRKGKRGTKKIVERNAIDRRLKGYLYYVKKDRSGHLKVHKSKMKRRGRRRSRRRSRSRSRS